MSDPATPGPDRPEPKLTTEHRITSSTLLTAADNKAPLEPTDAPPPPTKRRWRITLSTTILALIMAIIGVLSGVLIVTGWHYSTSNARDLSTQLMDRLTRHVVDRTIHYLEPAEKAAALSRELSRNEVVRTDDWHQTEQLFTQLLRVHPQLAMFNYGDEQGNFLMVKRFPAATGVSGHAVLPPGSAGSSLDLTRSPAREALPFLRRTGTRLALPPAPFQVPRGAFSTKIVRRTGGPLVLWKYRDTAHRLRAVSISSAVRYDPRSRPWYQQSQKSGKQGWTGVYLFFTDKKPGIASTTPVFDPKGRFKGALSVEIELYRISEFLATKRVGDRGRLFLINPHRKVVAYSEVDRLRRKVTTGGKTKWVLHEASKSPDPEVRASFAELLRRESSFPPKKRHIFEFDEGGRRWFAMFSPFPARAGKRWTVGILVAEDLILGTIKRNRWMNVFISLGVILAAMLLAVFLSRAITRPLGRLVAETERIRRLDLRGDVDIRSSLKEVDQMVSSVQQMKAGLRSFEKYVPRDLVRQLVRTGQEAQVHGETRELSILFTDIAGFTSIAEGLDPEELVALLNRYFDHATNVLLTHGATIDKYIGDAIMAFWGAPQRQEDHAEQACRAALGLREALSELNARWARDGQPEMHTRIGVHTGDVVVGNIGSDERLSYTIIGDSVNLASRIEGINKRYGIWVAVSEETYDRVKETFVGRAIDIVAVKGRREGVLLYNLRCLRSGASETELEVERLSSDALRHYRARRWEDACAAWQEIQRLLDGADSAAALMIRRCHDYRAAAPGADWNGVYVATTK